jgi:hypothetical protein
MRHARQPGLIIHPAPSANVSRKPVTGTGFFEMFPENWAVRRSGLSPVLSG